VASRDEIVSFCDELLAIDEFEDYGPNGLQVPGAPGVTRVATGVTANREFLAGGVKSGAELLIAHHGLFFGDGGGGLSEQLAARAELESLNVVCEGLAAQVTDAQHKLAGVNVACMELEPAIDRLAVLQQDLEHARIALQALRRDDDTLAARCDVDGARNAVSPDHAQLP